MYIILHRCTAHTSTPHIYFFRTTLFYSYIPSQVVAGRDAGFARGPRATIGIIDSVVAPEHARVHHDKETFSRETGDGCGVRISTYTNITC